MNRSVTAGTNTLSRIDTQVSTVSRATLADVMDPEFYKKETWTNELLERLFKIQARETTVKLEIYYGVIHFISCFYCLAVIPQQMNKAGYNTQSTFVATAACSGIGSIILGLFANLPFVMAPPTVVTIFFSLFLQNYISSSADDAAAVNDDDTTTDTYGSTSVGSAGVIISGSLLMLMGYRPLGNFIGRLIPYSLQAGTAIGIGLLTALAGMTDIDFVTTGSGSELLRMAPLTFEIGVAIAGVIVICLANCYHIKGSFCIAIVICSFVYNFYSHGWPKAVYSSPQSNYFNFIGFANPQIPLMVADLLFLYILYLNGLISSLSYLAGLTREDGAIPRGRWVFMLSGIITIASGLLTGAPVLISPESAAAIKEGAKTGLSAFVCGLLFVVSILFAPLFEAIPNAGTAPILFMIGVLLFQNVLRVDWKNVGDATPAFVVLFFIPFSFSVIQGVLVGYVVYIIVGIFTGSFFVNFAVMAHIYFPVWASKAGIRLPLKFEMLLKGSHGGGEGGDDGEDGEDSFADDSSIRDSFTMHNSHEHPLGSPRQHNAAAADILNRESTNSDASHSSITNMLNRVIFSAETHSSNRKNSADRAPTAGATRSRRNTVGTGKDDASEYTCMGFEGDHLFDISLMKLAKAKAKSNAIASGNSGAMDASNVNSNFSGQSDKHLMQAAAVQADVETGIYTSNPLANGANNSASSTNSRNSAEKHNASSNVSAAGGSQQSASSLEGANVSEASSAGTSAHSARHSRSSRTSMGIRPSTSGLMANLVTEQEGEDESDNL
jgi:AGZA family xanthine/uracil permease-like MFS transporter